MATAEDIKEIVSPHGDHRLMNERQAAQSHGSVRTLMAGVVIRFIALTVVVALVALMIALAS